ncbi:sulfate adenylyltransferase subunit CysN [Endozoicomonas sp. ONNA2]|uniref:sulfate adenylyltransferase subunit CysN n=1 Tax=Endozoicomonas sp. ONNA2 TaxID=2828741 RepID=UPI00214985CE|nr:sulfate adenylyltransferase subunit CysN [Endozoicomonas sp. ONNA2]
MSHQSELIATDIEEYLNRHEQKEMLRFLTCGSVDDGKSTLIGRLLHDTRIIYEDQLAAVENDSKRAGTQGGKLDLALLVDGLQAEREQGITIDVAYRYFSTEKRKYIIADTPGHEQYTRNMATGASTCDLAIILIDARQGVLTQTRRHTYIASLLGIKHIVVAINKMDLVDFSKARFEEIRNQYLDFAEPLQLGDIQFVPMSALEGDNVVHRSERMSWYRDSTLMDVLENVEIARDRNLDDFRFPVQYVNRPNLDFRGFSGTLASGKIKPGDQIKVLPSGQVSTIARIVTWDGELPEAHVGQAVTLTLTDEIDISRGEMLVRRDSSVQVAADLDVDLVWMAEQPMSPGRQYQIKFSAGKVSGSFAGVDHRVDVHALAHHPAGQLALNEIGLCQLRLTRAVPVESYRRNRQTGAFIVIDRISNDTVAAGMVRGVSKRSTHGRDSLSRVHRQQRMGQKGGIFRVARQHADVIERQLFDRGFYPLVINGDDEQWPAMADALLNAEVAVLVTSEAEVTDNASAADSVLATIVAALTIS